MRTPSRIVGAVLASCLLVLGVLPGAAAASPEDDPAIDLVRVRPAPPDDTTTAARGIVAAMSTTERAATVVMGHIPTTDPAALRDYMTAGSLGGFILMGANVPGSEAALRGVTDALTVDPSLPPLIAIDQEGGGVSRLPWDSFPGPRALQQQDPSDAARVFAARGSLVARAGANVNFGIVADVPPDPGSFIFGRALGTTAERAAARVGAAVGAEEPFVASTLKHFPGHGAAPGDSHRSIPASAKTLEQWSGEDAVPFAAGIDAGARVLMFGHLAYTAVDDAPASLSAAWHEIARDRLGFDGVIITDDLGMLQTSGVAAYGDPVTNAVAAIGAGNDMVLAVALSSPQTAPRMVEGISAAVDSGTLPAERLQDAAERVIALRLQLAADGTGGWVPCPDCAPAE